MPRAVAIDDDPPRRSRGAITVEPRQESGRKGKATAERGLLLRVLLRSPKDSIAAALACAAVIAIIVNALLLQAGHHPSPMFGAAVALPLPPSTSSSTSPLPRPRPSQADAGGDDARAGETGSIEIRDATAIAHPVKAVSTSHPAARAAAPHSSRRDPLGELIVSSRRVVNVQRALTRYGYGQLKATGTVGPDTQAAIQKFERERKLPVSGQISDRLVRELAAVTGQSID